MYLPIEILLLRTYPDTEHFYAKNVTYNDISETCVRKTEGCGLRNKILVYLL